MATTKVNTQSSIKDVVLTVSESEAALIMYVLGRNTGYDSEVSQVANDLYAALTNVLMYGDVPSSIRVEDKDYYASAVTLDTDKTKFVGK